MSVKKYDNQSNPIGTNIFETCVGSLNIAPIKISGQYKIVVDINGILYLDDYTGRKVIIDKSRNFLSQVSDFLKVKTTIVDNSLLKYGAFQKSTKKYYHIPLYLGSSDDNKILPKYFVLSRVVNETINKIQTLYEFGKLQQVINLDKIGLTNIFNEILTEENFNYPIYFDFEESNISLYGYSIVNNIATKHTFSLKNSQANQPYLEILNNTILNTFVNQQIFYPKFINIEFEFDYSNEYQIFNNFYGYLSYGKEINQNEIKFDNNFNIKLQDYSNNTIIWNQQFKNDIIELKQYFDISDNGSIQDINEQNPQIRFLTNNLSIDDKIIINHPDGSLIYEYIVKEKDIINESLYQSFKKICYSATKESKNNFVFSVLELNDKSCIIKIILNYYDLLSEQFNIELPIFSTILDRYNITDDNYYKFRGIILEDICLIGNPNLLNDIERVKINDNFYTIIDKFKFNNKSIIRLNELCGINKISECIIYNEEYEKLIELTPINFLNYNSTLKSYLPFEQDKYVNELYIKFDAKNNQTINDNLILFNLNKEIPTYSYINDNKSQIDDLQIIDLIDYNDINCLNMLFASVGQTAYITPNILNIDEKFYIQNGNLDTNKLNEDLLRYNWFLIKGICPDYLKSDIRQLRYFTNIPQITSTLIKITDSYCETIFLGVKYQLPIKYENFQFATYLNFNNQDDININYKFEINIEEKTIYLSVNKYLDFNDLIRGENNLEPLLDLSFFYSINNSFNSTSEYVSDFISSSIKLCNDFDKIQQPIFFESESISDWKHIGLDKEYIALRLSNILENNINDFRILFKISNESEFYVYSTLIYNNIEYTYCSMTVRLSNIIDVKETYLWCENIYVKFFDSDKITLQRFDKELNKIIYKEVDKSLLVIDNINNNFFIETTIPEDLNNYLIFPNEEISIKENYFEIIETIAQNKLGERKISKKVFKFKENLLTDLEIITKYDNIEENDILDINDIIISESKITLFDRNQIWNLIQSLFKNNLKFKNSSKELIRKYINKLMIINLIDYSSFNFINIKNTDEFINLKILDIDKNIVIWNILNQNKIIMINRFRTGYLPYMELFNDEKEFQLKNLKQYNTLFNIYDKNFGGLNISATGIWDEVQGNIVSSLFCKKDDIKITIDFTNIVDYKKLLLSTLNVEDLIITDINSNFIKNFNQNINEYILESYVDYILFKFYDLYFVINEYSQKLIYTIDNKNNTLLYFQDSSKYIQTFNKLIFIFKRK